ncbi:MAG: PEGA domain-containing protein [Deltaproteobacteria bacterium]|nr:PEGA domain-containing protein [Deltaproteobacteria bacterium]
MAEITCEACGRRVGAGARSCPACGLPVAAALADRTRTVHWAPSAAPRERKTLWITTSVAVAVAAVLVAVVVSRCGTQPATPEGGSPPAATSAPRPEASAPPPETSAPPAAAAPATGSVQVRARPWAQIIVDGRPMGTTPRTLELPVGEHVVRLCKASACVDETVVVEAGVEKPVWHEFEAH